MSSTEDTTEGAPVEMLDNPMVEKDGAAKEQGGDIELTATSNDGEGTVRFAADDGAEHHAAPRHSRKSKLKHMITMGGHDGTPLGFKIQDIMDELERRPGDDHKDKTLIKLLSEADKDGDGVVTLWELTEMAKALEADEKRISNYKKVLAGACAVALLLMMMFVGLVAAGVELTKESRVVGNSFQKTPGQTLTPRAGTAAARRLQGGAERTSNDEITSVKNVYLLCNDKHLLPLECPTGEWSAHDIGYLTQDEADKVMEDENRWGTECNKLTRCIDGEEPALDMEKMTKKNFEETGDVALINAQFNAQTVTEKKWKFKASSCLPNNVLENVAEIGFTRTCKAGSWQRPQEFVLSVHTVEVNINPPTTELFTDQGVVQLQGMTDTLVPFEYWKVSTPKFHHGGELFPLKSTLDNGCTVSTILYVNQLPQGMEWTNDEVKCANALSSSDIKGNTADDEYAVVYEEYIKCDPIADIQNPLCASYDFALNAKYKKVPHVLYHIKNEHDEIVTMLQKTEFDGTFSKKMVKVTVQNIDLGKKLSYQMTREAYRNFSRSSRTSTSIKNASVAKCHSGSGLTLKDPTYELGSGNGVYIQDNAHDEGSSNSARRRLTHSSHRARRLGLEMNARHHSYSSFDVNLVDEHARTHPQRKTEHRVNHLAKWKRRRLETQEKREKSTGEETRHASYMVLPSAVVEAYLRRHYVTASQAKTLPPTAAPKAKESGKGKHARAEAPLHVCEDTVKNGEETDVDCGGTKCRRRCAIGQQCKADFDCASGECHPDSKLCVPNDQPEEILRRKTLIQNSLYMDDFKRHQQTRGGGNKKRRRRLGGNPPGIVDEDAFAAIGGLAGNGPPLQGTVKVGFFVALFSDSPDIDKAKIENAYGKEVGDWLTWASYGKLKLDVTFFYGKSSQASYSEWMNTGCVKPSAWSYGEGNSEEEHMKPATQDDFHVMTVMYYTKECVTAPGSSGSNNPVRIEFTHVNGTEGDPVGSPSLGINYKAKTFVHELMHAVGLKYHMNQFRCTDGTTDWRMCKLKSYGNQYDVLGTGNSPYLGLGAQPRMRMGWIKKDTEIKVVTKSEVDIILHPVATATANVHKAIIIKPAGEAMRCVPPLVVEYRKKGTQYESNLPDSVVDGLWISNYGTGLIKGQAWDSSVDNWANWQKFTIKWGTNFTDAASGLTIYNIQNDGFQYSTVKLSISIKGPKECKSRRPSLEKSMFGHYYPVELGKGERTELAQGFKLGRKSVMGEPGLPNKYNLVPKKYRAVPGANSVNVDKHTAEYLSWYHDDRIDRIFYVQTQASRNNDELSCAPRPISYRVLNLPCGWEYGEAGSVRVACPGANAAPALHFGIPKGTAPGAYHLYIRSQHADHWFAPEDEVDVNGTSANTYELILCVDQYNTWYQTIGSGTCNGEKVTPKPWNNELKQRFEAQPPCVTLDNALNSWAHHELFDDRFLSWNWRHAITHDSVALDVEFKSISIPRSCVKDRLSEYKYDVSGVIKPYKNSSTCPPMPKKTCQIYKPDALAPTVAEVLRGLGAGGTTYLEDNGPVVDPGAAIVPKLGWHTHSDDALPYIPEYDPPGKLRLAYHNALEPETTYRAFCAQEAGPQGDAEIANFTFTTKPKPAMIGNMQVKVNNTNLTSVIVNVTFNRNSIAGCFVTQKGAAKPDDGAFLTELLGQYAYANHPLVFEMFTGRPGRKVVKKGCFGNGYLERPVGCMDISCMEMMMYCVDPEEDQKRAEIAEFGLKYDREYWMWCSAGSYASSGNTGDEGADDLITVGPTAFRTPKDPYRCVRNPPSSDGFQVSLLRGDETVFGENTFGGSEAYLQKTSFVDKVHDFPTVLLVHSNEKNNYQGPKPMDALKCSADSDHKAEEVGWKLEGVLWDDRPVREEVPEAGWNPEAEEKDVTAGENISKYFMVADDFNASDRRLRARALAEKVEEDSTVGWKFDAADLSGPGSFALGIPRHVSPGFYRVRLRAVHKNLKNKCVDRHNANVHELLVCVCSGVKCGKNSITMYAKQGKGRVWACNGKNHTVSVYKGIENDYDCQTCETGSNEECATCDSNKAAEGPEDADNNCASCNNGYTLTNNKKCVLTATSGSVADADTDKPNRIEHLDFSALAGELDVDCSNKPADCKDLYDEGAAGTTPSFPWPDFISCEDEGFDACEHSAKLQLYCQKTCCTCRKSGEAKKDPVTKAPTKVTTTAPPEEETDDTMYISPPKASSAAAECYAEQNVMSVGNDGKQLWEATVCVDEDGKVSGSPEKITMYQRWSTTTDIEKKLVKAAGFKMSCGMELCGSNGCGKRPADATVAVTAQQQSSAVGEQVLVAAGGEMGIADVVSGNGATTGGCFDKWDQPGAVKPWDDFESCAAESGDCGGNEQVRLGCRKTCGNCEIAKEEDVEEYIEPVNHHAVKTKQCVAKTVNLFGLEFDLVMGDCYTPPTEEECLDRYTLDSNHRQHREAPGWFEGCQMHKEWGDCEWDADVQRGCSRTCELCKPSDVIPQFQLCIGEPDEETQMVDSYSIEGAEILYEINGRKCLKMYDPNKQYPATSGNLHMHVAIRLSECENEDSEECLRSRCRQHGHGVECDGEWITLHENRFEFGRTEHSVNPGSTEDNVVMDGPKSFFQFSNWGDLYQESQDGNWFGSARLDKRCYIKKDVNDEGRETWIFNECTLSDAWISVDHQTETNNDFEDYNDDNTMMSSCNQPSSTCVNRFMLPTSDSRHLAKPWSDFYSCEEEQSYGACTDGNAEVEEGCQCTCGHCVPDPFIKPEIPLSGEEMEDWEDEYEGKEWEEDEPEYPEGSDEWRRRRLKRRTSWRKTSTVRRRNARTTGSKRNTRTTDRSGRIKRRRRARKSRTEKVHTRVQERRRR